MPDGSWHYLVDPETYWAKCRERSERLYNENRWDEQATQAAMMPSPSDTSSSDEPRLSTHMFPSFKASPKHTKILKGRMAQKWNKRRSLGRDNGTISLPETVGTKRHEFLKSKNIRTGYRYGTDDTESLRSSGFFSMVRAMAWNW